MIVLNASFLPSDFESEVGRVPSGNAPYANAPLIVTLLRQASVSGAVVIVARPDDELSVWLSHTDTGSIAVANGGDTLRDSLRNGLKAAAGASEIAVIFADTLHVIPEQTDVLIVGPVSNSAIWTTTAVDETGRLEFRPVGEVHARGTAVAGVMTFSRPALLAMLLDESTTVWEALQSYHEKVPLTLQLAQNWLDFGHFDTIFESRRAALASRAFNEVSYRPATSTVRKSSLHAGKLNLEAQWFRQLPAELRKFVPAISAVEHGSYELEYLPLLTMAEVLLCGDMDVDYWLRVFSGLERLLREFSAAQCPEVPVSVTKANLTDMYVHRVLDRLGSVEALAELWPVAVNGMAVPSFDDFVDNLASSLAGLKLLAPTRQGLIHGDLFLGNMFFDRRTALVRLVDPRGSFGSSENGGDKLYDLAKLSHSLLGQYDFIVGGLSRVRMSAGAVELDFAPNRQYSRFVRPLAQKFLEAQANALGSSLRSVRALESLLFISMVPMHADSRVRQRQLLANGLKIWQETVCQ